MLLLLELKLISTHDRAWPLLPCRHYRIMDLLKGVRHVVSHTLLLIRDESRRGNVLRDAKLVILRHHALVV